MYVYYLCAWYLQISEEDVLYAGTGTMDSCEPPYGCWNLNSGPLQKHQVFSMIESTLQALHIPLLQHVMLFKYSNCNIDKNMEEESWDTALPLQNELVWRQYKIKSV